MSITDYCGYSTEAVSLSVSLYNISIHIMHGLWRESQNAFRMSRFN